MLIAIIGNSAESMLNFRGSLIQALVARGHSIAAFAPDLTDATRRDLQGIGATPYDFPLSRAATSPGADLRTITALRKTLSRLRPDATLCYFIKPAVYGNIAAWLTGVRRRIVLLEGLGYSFGAEAATSLRRQLINCVVRSLINLSLSKAQITFVLNEDDKDVLISQIGVRKTVTNMGGIGVELDRFRVAPVRERASTFAMAARLIAEKGVAEFAAAARQIRTEYPATRFILLGDVDENPSSLTRAEVTAWQDEGVIEWPGRVDDIQKWLTQADVFILPSFYREGVPRSIQEAMALGRAIITTDHVGCRDTVVEGVNGFLVPTRDVGALVQRIRRFITEPGLAQRAGAASRVMAEERFSATRADRLVIDALENSPHPLGGGHSLRSSNTSTSTSCPVA